MLTNHRRVRLAVTVALMMVASACSRAAERGGAGDPEVVNITIDPPNKVTCDRGEAADVGPQGASVSLTRGFGHQLHVPAGSVPPGSSMQFNIRDLRKPYVAVAATHNGPAGTKFDPELRLRLSYAGCDAPDEAGLGIYRWTAQGSNIPPGGAWVRVSGSYVDTAVDTVSAPLDSLSEYALGAG